MYKNNIAILFCFLSFSPFKDVSGLENQVQNSGNSKHKLEKTQQTFIETDIEMVFVEGGTFQMGSDDGEADEKPVHSVKVSDFYIGKYEVTQKQWRAIMNTNPSYFENCDNCPVEKVSWNDATAFIKKLNEQFPPSDVREKYRLPTKVEWEYAARGGNKSKGYTYSGSNNIDEVAWYSNNSYGKTHTDVRNANELGIYNMSGNVWEWCEDWYKGYPGSSGVIDYTGSFRVNRGGSWYGNSEPCRVANRGGSTPDSRSSNLGFRIVFSVR